MERNKQFDVLLVIGITYVVVGHCGGFTLFQEWFPAGSFHMLRRSAVSIYKEKSLQVCNSILLLEFFLYVTFNFSLPGEDYFAEV